MRSKCVETGEGEMDVSGFLGTVRLGRHVEVLAPLCDCHDEFTLPCKRWSLVLLCGSCRVKLEPIRLPRNKWSGDWYLPFFPVLIHASRVHRPRLRQRCSTAAFWRWSAIELRPISPMQMALWLSPTSVYSHTWLVPQYHLPPSSEAPSAGREL
jgi:hypothetical protein